MDVAHWPMRTTIVAIAVALGGLAGLPAPGRAQSFPFSRAVDAGTSPAVTIETLGGQVDVSAGDGPVAVEGTVVVRLGWNVPADAPALARAVAAAPPIAVTDGDVRLTLPADTRSRAAVLIHWRVRVPTMARVTVRTRSGEVRLAGLGAPARVRSGSGLVTAHAVRGGVAVEGQSGAIALDGLAGDVHVRTGSGDVRIAMAGAGAVDVATRSSAIDVQGASSGLRAVSGSGAIEVAGSPGADWFLETSSSRITIRTPGQQDYRLDLRSRSGRVASDRSSDRSGEHALVSDVGTGVLITARSGSGAIALRTQAGS